MLVEIPPFLAIYVNLPCSTTCGPIDWDHAICITLSRNLSLVINFHKAAGQTCYEEFFFNIFNQYVQMQLMDDNERISWELFIFSEQYCDWRARASEAEGQEQLRNPNHNGAAPITVIHSPTTIIALDHSGCVKIGNIWFHLNQRNEYIYSCEQFAIYKYSIF